MSTTLSEKSWNSSDDYDDDNSSTTTSSAARRISGDLDIPGGVITTHCVSSVIKPGSKQNHDPLQFVKIQSTELSRKAVEQIRLAEEVKITKEKIKEVEEEWQNNLLNWKSKRRQTRSNYAAEECENVDQQTRKVKTFSEIIKEKAKSGHRIGYNLDKYIDDHFESDVNHGENGDSSGRVVTESVRNRLDNESSFSESNCDENEANVKYNNTSNDQNTRRLDHVNNRQQMCNNSATKAEVRKGDFNNKKKEHKREKQEAKYGNESRRESHSKQSPNDSSSNNGQSFTSQSDQYSGDEDDDLQESYEDKEMEAQQILSFKAKLSAFESLAKPVEKCPNSRSKHLVKIEPWKQDERCEQRPNPAECNSLSSIRVTRTIRPQATVDDLLQRDKQLLQQKFYGHKCQDNSLEQQKVHQTLDFQQQQQQHADYDSEINEISERMMKSNGNNNNNHENIYRVKECELENGCQSEMRQTSDSVLQFDQKQYYLLDDVYPEKPCNREYASNESGNPLYSNSEQLDIVKQQTQRMAAETHLQQQQQQQLPSHALPQPQSNHCLYYGVKHNNNPQLNVGHEYQPALKPVPQTRHASNACPTQQQQILPRQQQQQQYQNYSHQNHTKPLSPSQPHMQQIQQPSPYNLNHWIIQEAELRRQLAANNQYQPKPVAAPRMNKPPPPPPPKEADDMHLYENSPLLGHVMQKQETQKQQKRMLSVSGRKKCSSCGDELGRGCAAMVIESLSLYYHINCFRCSVCHIQLGNGTCGTDVRVRNNKLHCKNCYSNDEG